MNARSFTFALAVEGRQLDEVLASIFHTVLFHRSCGKFTYTSEESYSIRTVRYLDVDCDFIDFTYVCCESPALARAVQRDIADFSSLLRGGGGGGQRERGERGGRGAITLEFFQKRRARWPFQAECVPWEVWTVRCALGGEECALDTLQDKIVFITEIINRHEYVPKMPSRSDLDLIFDTSFGDIQPYLFKIHYSLDGAPPPTVGNTVRKLIRDTLAL